MKFELPAGLTAADEGRHPVAQGAEDILFGDSLWMSVVGWEVEETGEVGTGGAEWSVYPPWPRFLA